MKEPRPLLALYKLLWEQIKDKENVEYLNVILIFMSKYEIITPKEEDYLSFHIIINIDKKDIDKDRKAFVQRMIKELENEK